MDKKMKTIKKGSYLALKQECAKWIKKAKPAKYMLSAYTCPICYETIYLEEIFKHDCLGL